MQSIIHKYGTPIAACFFWGTAFIRLLPAIFGNHSIGGDLLPQIFPYRYFLGKNIIAGHFPTWVASINYGIPFAAEPQSGWLYPPNWIFAPIAFLYGPNIWQFDSVFHAGLLGFGMFLFFRDRGFDFLPSLLGGVILVSSAFSSVHIGHNSLFQSIAWIGPVLISGSRTIQKPSFKSGSHLAFALLLSYTAGSPPAHFILLLASFSFFIYEIYIQKNTLRKVTLTQISGAGLALILFFILPVLALTGISYPLYELTARKDWNEEMRLGFHAKWRSYWSFLFSRWFTYRPDPGHWEYDGFIGAGTIFLGIARLTMRASRNKHIHLLAIFLICCGLILANANNPIFKFLSSHAPGFSHFRVPGRYIFLAIFGFSILAVDGLSGIIELVKYPSRLRIIFFLLLPVALLIVPFYKNKEFMPPLSRSFIAVLPDITLMTVSSILLIIITISYKSKQTRIASSIALIILIGTSNTLSRNILVPFNQILGAEQFNVKQICSAQSSHDLNANNFGILCGRWEIRGASAMEMQSSHDFKKALGRGLQSNKLYENSGFKIHGLVDSQLSTYNIDSLCNKKNQSGIFCTEINVLSHFDGEMMIQINNSETQGYVIIKQTWYPGWSATSRGISLPVVQANLHWIAIDVPQGATTIILEQVLYLKWPWHSGFQLVP